MKDLPPRKILPPGLKRTCKLNNLLVNELMIWFMIMFCLVAMVWWDTVQWTMPTNSNSLWLLLIMELIMLRTPKEPTTGVTVS